MWAEIFSIAYQFADVFAFLVLAAAGLAIIFGMMGIINMAHGEFITCGIYVTVIGVQNGLPLPVAQAVGALTAGLIGILDEYTNSGSQDYRGMRLSVQRRAATGLSFSANYTLGRCHGLEMNTNAQFGATYTDPNNPDHDRGYCDTDRTHIANATIGIETPQFSNAVLRALASSWGVSAILSARSGSRFSVTTGVDSAFSGISNQRANQVSDDLYGDTQEDAQGRLANYLTRAAFAAPAPGTLGNSPRNEYIGPAYWNGVNLALRRLIALGGTQNIELRIEAFNLLNNFI